MILKSLMLFAGLSGFVSVLLGAFAAHGLKGKLTEPMLHAFETGVSYQMQHSLALFIVCILMLLWGEKPALLVCAFAFVLGILFFSGSLYALSLTGEKWFGPITPLGGAAFLFGWLALVTAVWNQLSTNPVS